ncbi:MAG: MmgE/PrpD family protein [Rhodospirillaceae bacterium]|nr:MmgE/PrpD family protein [Rhodospirillaceae bacterium]
MRGISATFSERIAQYICGEDLSNIDAEAVERAKQRLAYHLGLAFHGLKARDPEIERAVAVARDLSDGGGNASLIGLPWRTTVADAVFVNSQMMRAFGRDDVIFETGVHPGLVTLPLAWSLGERHRATGAAFLTAIVVGYEMMGKFARWSWTLDAPRRATMPFGPFGSIATAARILELDPAQTAVALAYAAHTAMGVAESDAGPIPHYYGLVCRNGLVGACLAKSGAWGSPTVLEGEFGFLETFLGSAEYDQDALLASLGRDYAIMTSEEKHYPGTGLNQVPIELMRGFVLNDRIGAGDVESIHVTLPAERKNFRASYARGPFTPRTSPSSALFQFGALLVDGDLRPDRYEDVDHPDIRRLIDNTRVDFVDGKSVRYARLEVATRDGRVLVGEGDEFAYEPESPEAILTREADGILAEAKIERACELIGGLENVGDVAELTACLVP